MRTDKIHYLLASKYNLPVQVITMICNHPFIFTSRKMADHNDMHDIRLPYLGIFKLRSGVRSRLDLYNELTGKVGSLDLYKNIKLKIDELATEDRT